MRTNYSVGTIRADRGQKSFKLSLSAFMTKRGAATIAAALFDKIDCAGPLVAIVSGGNVAMDRLAELRAARL